MRMTCVAQVHSLSKHILPIYPNPLIINGPNVDERQHHSDGHFTPKKYLLSPILESRVERIDMKMKWMDQVCIVLCNNR